MSQDSASIGTLRGRIHCPYVSKGLESYFNPDIWQFGGANLIYQHGKFYLCVSVKRNAEPVDRETIQTVVGIDRGINFLVATYDSSGTSGFVSGKAVKQKRAHYQELRSELQKRKTPSARHRLKQIGERENRWMRDLNHCISKALVQSYPKNTMFVLEDLSGIRSATERVKRKHRYVSVSWAYYDLEQKLIYKAQDHQQLVIKVPAAYTSQRCPCCGHTERANRNKRKHLFTCKCCGYQSNDDRVAAINLYQMGNSIVPRTGTGK